VAPPSLTMFHLGVGGRDEHALVAVAPPDQVGRRTLLPVDLDDHPFAVLIAHTASSDDQFIADFRALQSSLTRFPQDQDCSRIVQGR
jgi:hypothetical protein